MENLGPPNAIPQLRNDVDLRGLKLSPPEMYVITRVDGQTRLEDLCLSTGLGDDETRSILHRLIELGIVEIPPPVPEQPPAPRSRSAVAAAARAKTTAQNLRIKTGQHLHADSTASPAAATAPTAQPPAVSSGEAGTSTSESAGGTVDGAVGAPPKYTMGSLPAVSIGDSPGASPRRTSGMTPLPGGADNDVTCDLDEETKKRIDDFVGRMREMDLFELLGCDLGADRKQIRRAYADQAKKFHPDRFFGRQLGGYRVHLTKIFQQVNSAFEFLQADDRRAAYEVEARKDRRARDLQDEEQRAKQELATLDAEPADADRTHRAKTDPLPEAPGAAAGAPIPPTPAPPSARSTPVRQPASRDRRITAAIALRTGKFPTVQKGGATPKPPEPSDPKRDAEILRSRVQEAQQRRQRLYTNVPQRRERGQRYYAAAIERMRHGDHEAAFSNLRLAVDCEPQRRDYMEMLEQLRGKVAEERASHNARRAEFEEQAKRFETAALLWVRAAEARPRALYHRRAAEAFLLSAQLKVATEHAIRAKELEPESGRALLTLARVYAAARKIKDARAAAEGALKVEPGLEGAREVLKSLASET